MPGLRKLMTKELQETTKISPSLQEFHFKITNELFNAINDFLSYSECVEAKENIYCLFLKVNHLRYNLFIIKLHKFRNF